MSAFAATWPTLFGDDIFTSTDLQRRSSEVLSCASKHPVTISRNSDQFALLRREQLRDLLFVLESSKTAIRTLLEVNSAASGPTLIAREFSWLGVYEKDDLERFARELLAAIGLVVSDQKNPQSLELLIHEWHESALAMQSGVVDEAMHSDPEEEIEIFHPESMVPAPEVGQ